MYSLVRPLLFHIDPERVHDLTLALVRLAGDFPIVNSLLSALYDVSDPRLESEAFGVRFRNPVGLAAGYDKNGTAVKGLSCLGFGHIEVGTVTCLPQGGNPKPRIHRFPTTGAIINSMGFPNVGVDALRVRRGMTRVGINIGISKDTPLERAAQDYCTLLMRVHSQADYVALNVSSPNTPGLRDLQSRTAIRSLLEAVSTTRNSLWPRVSLLVKISPDLSEAEIDDVLTAVNDYRIDGVIATNTTLNHDDTARYRGISGGLSGAPLRQRATEVIRYIARRSEGQLPIVGVGGIANLEDALEKIYAGARLIQIYTGLVYAGPGLVRVINLGLVQACKNAGVRNVGELART